MAALLVRIALLAAGIGLGQLALDSFARGSGLAVVELGLAFAALLAGSAGFMVPLFAARIPKEARDD